MDASHGWRGPAPRPVPEELMLHCLTNLKKIMPGKPETGKSASPPGLKTDGAKKKKKKAASTRRTGKKNRYRSRPGPDANCLTTD